MKYKAYRIIDGKPRWIVIDENGNIINRFPKKGELKGLDKFPEKDGRCNSRRHIKYNDTNTCDRCGKSFDESGYPLREYNEKGDWTRKWDCHNCWQKYDPNSQHNVQKLLRNRRTGNLKEPRNILGDNCEELTCRWRGVKNLNKENDNYSRGTHIDHSRDSELGIIQTKGRSYDSVRKSWGQNWRREWYNKFDFLIFYCISKDGIMIERIYIFPWEEIANRTGISIYENKRRLGWYEKYRVKDEELMNRVNEIWEQILKENNL